MKHLFVTILMTFLCGLASLSALACPGAYISLNNDTTLTGDSLISIAANKTVSAADFIGKSITASDKEGKATHVVTVLGQKADAKGVFSTAYLVKDLNDKSEKILLLSTGYAGNGSYSRGLELPTGSLAQDNTFSSLYKAGCD